ncbi:MAG: multidrug efflux system outer membrane protein [Phycisphaerales bacterium]|jgi:multidrug efflux system outer membrane protein
MIALSGCTVGPTYKKPTTTIPIADAWQRAIENDFTTDTNQVHSWWLRFDDEELVKLIEDAQKNNITLKIAVSNLLQARAAYGVASAKSIPDVLVKGRAEHQQASDNSPTLSAFPNVNAEPVEDYAVGLDSSWELDLWGGIEKNIEAASATEGAELEHYRDVLITIRAEVASTYITIRVLQVSKELIKQSLATLKEMLSLIESQYEQGIISKTFLEQERAMYDQNSIQLPDLEMQLVQQYARLAILLSTDTQTIKKRLSKISSVPRAKPEVAVGIPADLVRRRPDIRQAERTLAAQTALVGSAMSNLYPKLSLSGSFGYEATTVDTLIRWDSRTYAFGPTVSWDIFNGNRIKNQIKIQEEKTSEAYLNWELTVLKALAEVEISMLNLIESGKVQDAMNDASQSLFEALVLTTQEQEAGVILMQSVLNVRLNFLSSQLVLVEKIGFVSNNLVALYKALGGDWEKEKQIEVIHIRNEQ